MNYLLTSNNEKKVISKIVIKNKYEFNPKNKQTNLKSIKSITIYDEEKIGQILLKKYIIKYQKLKKIITTISEEDDNADASYNLALNELYNLKKLLIYKYQKYFDIKLSASLLKDLATLEKYLKEHLIKLNNQSSYCKGR